MDKNRNMKKDEYIMIREVEENDSLSLARIIRKAFEEYGAPMQGTVYSDPTTDDLYRLFKVEKSVLWVALTDDKIAGCCGIYPTKGLPENCAELVKFYLSAESRRKGIGKALLARSIESARLFGYTKLYLESLPHFNDAVKMYEKRGFSKLDKPLGESGHNACNIWMIKDL
jgi:putative acetyltransferase